MTQEDSTKVEGTEVTTKGTSDFGQWGTFIWKLFIPTRAIRRVIPFNRTSMELKL